MKTKTLLILSFQLITLSVFGQATTKSIKKQLIIDRELISKVEITNNCYPTDSCKIITYTLNDSMTVELVERLNNSSSTGPCKFYVLYWLDIHLQDGTKRSFRINGQSIKENNDWCFDIKSPDIAEKIWTEMYNE